ncbi:MAG: UDP-N-acetylmuramoyl-tripeptide--D-alanyl-D-alanine ligase [Proteobacteria bacterium]|nr:UDP-N-acetylmuramoyl-tripeptide--D-alanyl-D-alanine ligase [Pseudomonadota bacterium]
MMKLSQAAQILQAKLQGPDGDFNGVSTDTRTLAPGQLFVALRGGNFDGHHFLKEAVKAKAVGALISQDETAAIPTIKVANTRQALADLSRFHRQQFSLPIIAVTGSCGKTTTRALLASVFSQAGNTLYSVSSFNNDIGVPLTLLKLNPEHQYAIIEMGANHAGEIAFLTHLVHPDVAIITNAAAAHLEGFGSLDGVACAKGEIFQGLASHGTAVINADDQYAEFWKQLAGSRRIVTFGLSLAADVRADNIEYNENGQPSFELTIREQKGPVQLQLMGRHNVHNALAAAAAGFAQGLSFPKILAGLNQAAPEKQRLVEQRSPEGAIIIDDSYNANPLSMRAAIQLLALRSGERILVMGDMGELGEHAVTYHQQIGQEAKQMGIEYLFCYGQLSRHAAQAFGKKAQHFSSPEELVQALKSQLSEKITVLIKGSRFMKMEQVVAAVKVK